MTNALAKKSRPLAVLVPLIKKELKWGFEAGQRHWQAVGRMLNEAKAGGEVPYGEWQDWIAETFTHPMTGQPLLYATAWTWMKGAKKSTKSISKQGLSALTRKQSPNHVDYKPKLDWQTNVRKVQGSINPEKLAQQFRDRDQREAALRRMAMKIIDAGYRALSAVCHPDKPKGSAEAFKALNAAKKWAVEALSE